LLKNENNVNFGDCCNDHNIIHLVNQINAYNLTSIENTPGLGRVM
jgi:hypothetical protein